MVVTGLEGAKLGNNCKHVHSQESGSDYIGVCGNTEIGRCKCPFPIKLGSDIIFLNYEESCICKASN